MDSAALHEQLEGVPRDSFVRQRGNLRSDFGLSTFSGNARSLRCRHHRSRDEPLNVGQRLELLSSVVNQTVTSARFAKLRARSRASSSVTHEICGEPDVVLIVYVFGER